MNPSPNPKFRTGEFVTKTGTGYSGPGIVVTVFEGLDHHWRYVVMHRIDGGQGEFYHIYREGQLATREV